MPADPTLDLDLAAVTTESRRLAASIKPQPARWDVIVVGSGAAGGMAAFQLATAGIKVLVLEAGRMLRPLPRGGGRGDRGVPPLIGWRSPSAFVSGPEAAAAAIEPLIQSARPRPHGAPLAGDGPS